MVNHQRAIMMTDLGEFDPELRAKTKTLMLEQSPGCMPT